MESSASVSESSTAMCSQVEDGESNTSDFPSRYRCTAKSKHNIGYNRAWENNWPWLHLRKMRECIVLCALSIMPILVNLGFG